MSWATIATIITNAYILFSFILGGWALLISARGGNLGGQYWGAMWSCVILGGINLLVWVIRLLTGEQMRWVYGLYMAYFIIVYPGVFTMLRGRDDKTAAGLFGGAAVFTALAAIAALDPTRHVITP
jgi:hypothetical protein